MTKSADPDQLASSEANLSGSTLFAKTGHDVNSKRRVKRKEFSPTEHPFRRDLVYHRSRLSGYQVNIFISP